MLPIVSDPGPLPWRLQQPAGAPVFRASSELSVAGRWTRAGGVPCSGCPGGVAGGLQRPLNSPAVALSRHGNAQRRPPMLFTFCAANHAAAGRHPRPACLKRQTVTSSRIPFCLLPSLELNRRRKPCFRIVNGTASSNRVVAVAVAFAFAAVSPLARSSVHSFVRACWSPLGPGCYISPSASFV